MLWLALSCGWMTRFVFSHIARNSQSFTMLEIVLGYVCSLGGVVTTMVLLTFLCIVIVGPEDY